MISNREDVTKLIVARKVLKSIKWTQVSDATGLSNEWATAACLGQMTFNKQQAETVGEIFELPDEAVIPHAKDRPTLDELSSGASKEA